MEVIRIHTKGVEIYSWKGQPIHNLTTWCEANHTRLIPYRYTRRYYDPFLRQEIEEYHEGQMPETFFENLQSKGGEHWEHLQEKATEEEGENK